MNFVSDLLATVTERGRRWVGLAREERPPATGADLAALAATLLSRRGEASGVALARSVLDGYRTLDDAEKTVFLAAIADQFDADHDRLQRAIDAWTKDPSTANAAELHHAAEPRRQELIRRLNLAPGGTAALVMMRDDVRARLDKIAGLAVLDNDLVHLLSSWFNRGFLVVRRIDWSTPANILEKIIRYEAVHAIQGWQDLRGRLEPEDRRCYAFFHPQLADEPLIFVEVALTRDIPAAIAPLITTERPIVPAEEAATAVFYSISNCQRGLAGISFGSFLIKQVVEELRRELPGLKTFVTLSPVPGFAAWLGEAGTAALPAPLRAALEGLEDPLWHEDEAAAARLREPFLKAAAFYLARARNGRGKVIDPVARFHLGNGARLERLNFLGDRSPRGLRHAYGLMVNYLYDLEAIETNHEAFFERGTVATSSVVRKILGPEIADARP